MLEDDADLLQVTFAETSCDKNLDAYGEAHGQCGEHEIEEASHHGGAELVGAKMPEEGRVSKGNDGLRQIPQHDGIGDPPDFAVGDTRLDHGAKVRFLRYCERDEAIHFLLSLPTDSVELIKIQ